MTCFNEGRWIGAAVRSVLDQTAADRIAAIVIVDDGSAEDTRLALGEIEGWDERVRVVYGAGGAGPARNRNAGVEACDAPFVAFLDGDDLWTDDKLERQLGELERLPDVGLSYTGYEIFPDGRPEAARVAHVSDLSGAHDLARAYFLNDPPILPSTVLIRREAFQRVGGFDPTLRVFEETDFYLRLAEHTRFAALDAPLIRKRTHAGSLTGRRPKLMAHHAYVAFLACARAPRLLPLAPRRLAERARKLGNQAYIDGEVAEARGYWALAVKLDPTSLPAAAGWLAAAAGGNRLRRRLERRLASRAAATPSAQAYP